MADYEKIAKEARVAALKLIYNAQTSHLASCFSVADILAVLFEKIDLKKDKIILSCGWKAAIFYHFLAEKGFFPKEDLEYYCKEHLYPTCTIKGHDETCSYLNGNTAHDAESGHGVGTKQSRYIGLTEPAVPGVHYSGGSMGHGLPAAVGYALSKKLKGEKGNVYCLMSDGELAIGTTWESASIVAHHKLDNLVVIVDKNGLQAMGTTSEILQMEPLTKKWESFGWSIIGGIDGHSFKQLNMSLEIAKGKGGPVVLLCETVKGKGVSFMENNNEWHYRAPNKEHYEKALAELYS